MELQKIWGIARFRRNDDKIPKRLFRKLKSRSFLARLLFDFEFLEVIEISRFATNYFGFLILCVLLVSVLFPCASGFALTKITNSASDMPDYWPTDGWLTSTPEEQGMNSTMLEEVGDFISDRSWTMDSVVVIRNGYIVYEIYPNPEYNVSSLHSLASGAKSIISSIIGAAITRGNLSGIDETILDFFSDRTIQNLDSNKEAITIEHLLTMTSGLDWDDETVDGDLWALFDPIDFVQYILDKPMLYAPGTHYYYSTADSHLLSAIINETIDMNALEFGMEVLFGPLGISNVEWRPDNQGISIGGGWLNMTPRDLAKIGFLYMNNGTWDDQEIISSSYVQAATTTQNIADGWSLEYGFQWWIDPDYDAYIASGAGGQKLFVQPKNNLIVVVTGPGFSEDLNTTLPYLGSPDVLIKQMIIPSIIEASTSTPTPTTTTTDTGNEFPMLIPAVGLAVGVVAVVIVGFVMKRRNP